MDSGPCRNRAIALVAAYAMALQAFFAALAPAVPASAGGPFAMLCSHDADNSGDPTSHDLPCAALCAAMGQGITGPLPSGSAVSIVVPQVVAAAVPINEWVPPQVALNDTHAPRGPPLI